MTDESTALIDLPEFGGLDEWKAALAELQDMEPTQEVTEAILRCETEIAELEGRDPPTLGERMSYAEGSINFE